eukprot:scaffold22069_cov122-Isochrysis_galbana.AAC.10
MQVVLARHSVQDASIVCGVVQDKPCRAFLLLPALAHHRATPGICVHINMASRRSADELPTRLYPGPHDARAAPWCHPATSSSPPALWLADMRPGRPPRVL